VAEVSHDIEDDGADLWIVLGDQDLDKGSLQAAGVAVNVPGEPFPSTAI